jgi:hypothetical protein
MQEGWSHGNGGRQEIYLCEIWEKVGVEQGRCGEEANTNTDADSNSFSLTNSISVANSNARRNLTSKRFKNFINFAAFRVKKLQDSRQHAGLCWTGHDI